MERDQSWHAVGGPLLCRHMVGDDGGRKHGEQAWFTDQIDTASTDDKYLYINMDWFFKLTLDERLFVACHEIAHAMYGHAGLFYLLQKANEIRYSDGLVLPANGELLNIAADYVINEQLYTPKIGKMPDGGLQWPALITGDMAVLDAYRTSLQDAEAPTWQATGRPAG